MTDAEAIGRSPQDRRAGDKAPSPQFLAGGGEMGALMRAKDWSATPLGQPETWPQELRTAVRLLLDTRHPIFVFWGPALACLYNDAYRTLIGTDRHPSALGSRPGRYGPKSGTRSVRRSSR